MKIASWNVCTLQNAPEHLKHQSLIFFTCRLSRHYVDTAIPCKTYIT